MEIKLDKVVIPQLGEKDQYIALVEWYVKNGDKVSDGQVIAALELDKTFVELECSYNGYIFITVQEGSYKLPGELIAVVSDVNEPGRVKEMMAI